MKLSKTPFKSNFNFCLTSFEFVRVFFGEIVHGVPESADVRHWVTHHLVYEGGVEGAEMV